MVAMHDAEMDFWNTKEPCLTVLDQLLQLEKVSESTT